MILGTGHPRGCARRFHPQDLLQPPPFPFHRVYLLREGDTEANGSKATKRFPTGCPPASTRSLGCGRGLADIRTTRTRVRTAAGGSGTPATVEPMENEGVDEEPTNWTLLLSMPMVPPLAEGGAV